VDFVDQPGADFTSQAAGGIYVKGISRRGDDGVWWVMAEQPPLAGVEAAHESKDVSAASQAVAAVRRGLEPDLTDPGDGLLQESAAVEGRVVAADMRIGGRQDRQLVPIPDPLASEVKGTVFHPVLQGSCVVIDE